MIWPHTATWPSPLRRLADAKISPALLRGRPLIINFWASWCAPCHDEAPRLAASARAHAGRVVFLGVDVQDFTSDARRFLRKYRVDYVSARALLERFGSVAAVVAAGPDEWLTVPSIGRERARALEETFNLGRTQRSSAAGR